MSSDTRLIASRYVQALFDLASEGKQHDQVKADLTALKSALESNDAFLKIITSPAVSRDASQTALAKVLDGIKASELTKKFFTLLAHNRRLAATPQVIEQYLALLAGSRGELTVHVTSAYPLEKDEIKALAQAIAQSTGKKVDLKTKEDPALLGGLQVRVGSKMLDNSVAGKLARLKQRLSAA